MSDSKKSKTNIFVKMLGIAPLALGPIVSYNAIKISLNSAYLNNLIAPHVPQVWDFEGKITSLIIVSILLSAFASLCVVGTIVGRYITLSPNPLVRQDPPMILFFNRVLLNTLEQFAIFFPILAYWTLKFSTEANKHEVLIFGMIWIISRVIYLIGYGFNFISTRLSTFRVFGFQTGLLVAVVLALRIFGKHII